MQSSRADQLEVVAAVIEQDGRIFCARRSDVGETGLKWEFPGGKIKEAEQHREALIREIREELGVGIEPGPFLMTVEHLYQGFALRMHVYQACLVNCGPENIRLHEHIDACWLSPNQLCTLDWAAADIPVVERVKHHYIQL